MTASQLPKPLQELVQDGSLCVVPETHIVPPEERARPERSDDDFAPELPVIDMEGVDGERRGVVLRQIQKACEDWGFFQVKNHGVPLSLLKQMQEAATGFFNRPWEEKMSYRLKDEEQAVKSQGYGSKSAPKQGLAANWGDQLQHEVFPLSTRNYDLWPTNPSSFRETEEEFIQEQSKLSDRILELISESLGLKRSFMEDHFEEYKQVLVVNFYPPCPQPDLAMGIQRHSDFGLLTLLLQDTTPGLQVRKDGEWITVKPVDDAIVVNVGDQVQILTNGKYKSVEHRALVNSSKKRMSIAFFTNLNDDSVVAPVSDLMDAVTPPRYNQCAFGAYKAAAFATLGDPGKRLIERMEINF